MRDIRGGLISTAQVVGACIALLAAPFLVMLAVSVPINWIFPGWGGTFGIAAIVVGLYWLLHNVSDVNEPTSKSKARWRRIRSGIHKQGIKL